MKARSKKCVDNSSTIMVLSFYFGMEVTVKTTKCNYKTTTKGCLCHEVQTLSLFNKLARTELRTAWMMEKLLLHEEKDSEHDFLCITKSLTRLFSAPRLNGWRDATSADVLLTWKILVVPHCEMWSGEAYSCGVVCGTTTLSLCPDL